MHSFSANFRRNSSGAAVGDNSLYVERRKIRARANVAGFQFHAESERFDHTATDLEFQRVVAKQPEMPRPAAGRDAGGDGNHAALRRILRDLVEVRRCRGFKRRQVILFTRRDVAEAVKHDEHEFGLGFQCQFGYCASKFMRLICVSNARKRNAIPNGVQVMLFIYDICLNVGRTRCMTRHSQHQKGN